MFYRAAGGHFAVGERERPRGHPLIDHGEEYSITVDAPTPVGSLCLFFELGLAQEVYRGLTALAADLLGDPFKPVSPQLDFFERTYPHDAFVSPLLDRLRAAPAEHFEDRAWVGEQLHLVMTGLLRAHEQVAREVDRVPALRPATRDELYRRLHLAKDYLDTMSATSVALDDVAGVACLSSNHLLRTFRALFDQTPHQYLIARRLDHAQNLLRETEIPVTEICFAVGFQSPGSFSSLFRRAIGTSPLDYRRQSG